MANVDSLTEVKSLDRQNLSSSILELGKQCQQVWQEVGGLDLKDEFRSLSNIVVMGMGGSTLGTHIVQSLYSEELNVNLEYFNSYQTPSYVDKDSLVILSSYSGDTEEVLSAYAQAKGKTNKILAICSGGQLAKLVKSGEIQGYVFNPKFNPSGQPRMGLGYSILSQILILSKLGYLNFGNSDYQNILKSIEKLNQESNIEVGASNNKAKQVAQKLQDKVPFLLASEHLVGNIHTFANQINENAKSISAYFTLPEADHHLIEGLPSTHDIHGLVVFLFLNSDLYSERVAKRYPITQKLVEKAHFESVEIKPQGKSKLQQVFEFLTFGSWVSFYLAMLYGRDPSPIPNVDFLKKEMGKG